MAAPLCSAPNVSLLFTELSFLARFRGAAEAGLGAAEAVSDIAILAWTSRDPDGGSPYVQSR